MARKSICGYVMVRLSVSQAARLIGVSRVNLQAKINHNQLKTHEGYLTMDDLRDAYPSFNPQVEQDKLIARAQSIKESALYKISTQEKIGRKNQVLIDLSVKNLNSENKRLCQVIDELAHRLAILEHCCHQEDKALLHQLQDWLRTQLST